MMFRFRRLLVILYTVALFFIFEMEGYVALQKEDGSILRSSMPVDMLPPEAAAAVRSGIACNSAEEAARYIENFCS